ncbi:MAG: BON domain-containing protein [Bacteroidetes bacterium]|nr:BON domain-containing protein [Bacteroidota bacterium]
MKTDPKIRKDIEDELKWDVRINCSKINVDVSNDLKISIPGVSKRSDAEIKKTVFDSIKWNSSVKEDKINVEVKDGWVTLSGEVEWAYQKSKAKLLAEDIVGVTGVTNNINVVSAFSTNVQDVKHKINSALKRNHYLNSNKINVL